MDEDAQPHDSVTPTYFFKSELTPMNFFSLILKSLIIMNSRVARIVQRTAAFRPLPTRGGFPTDDPPAEKDRTIKHHVFHSFTEVVNSPHQHVVVPFNCSRMALYYSTSQSPFTTKNSVVLARYGRHHVVRSYPFFLSSEEV